MVFDYLVVWTELQVPSGLELHAEQWAGYFQPVIHAPGHIQSDWARVRERSDIVMLASLWHTAGEFRDFTASPCAQLYRENLASVGIIPVSSRETVNGSGYWFDCMQRSFVQLFWVYFPAPVTEDQRAQVQKLRGLATPAPAPGASRQYELQRSPPKQLWVAQTESWHGQEVQLLLWPHFWKNEEAAEWRLLPANHYETIMERFTEALEKVDPKEWKEEFYRFQKLPRL
ncbi:uncharacterized protein BO97DRAFT_139808 [Aspergillus homomorphus CBS 101889]|uniref:ABM domain-containing protein n=1 Tax=Aspergillus homomorphus (strain CBS 101889) TaxID=1450537 RepID=A0A395I8Q5_ASPHC|nr:hypothetical protein BO97DRAFT_139808 [Aspergillus homomorphus CBS 101889]RAL16622.1 hypothetical protein BO97DRAFT_139808 [Aspergillus homomorphus CBS 101889]